MVTIADGQIILWDLSKLQAPRPMTFAESATDFPTFVIDFKADIVVVNEAFSIGLWDISNANNPTRIKGWSPSLGDEVLTAVALSPNGNLLPAVDQKKAFYILDIANPSDPVEVAKLFLSFNDIVRNIVFSSDGMTIAIGSLDGTIRLLDISSPALPTLLGSQIKGYVTAPGYKNIAFVPNDDKLVWPSDDGIVVTDISAASLQLHACLRARRNLTQAEWSQFFPGEPYSLTCPQWPVG